LSLEIFYFKLKDRLNLAFNKATALNIIFLQIKIITLSDNMTLGFAHVYIKEK